MGQKCEGNCGLWVLNEIVEKIKDNALAHFFCGWDRIENMYYTHTIYSRNNIGQKCEGNCGLWVLNEIIKKT